MEAFVSTVKPKWSKQYNEKYYNNFIYFSLFHPLFHLYISKEKKIIVAKNIVEEIYAHF